MGRRIRHGTFRERRGRAMGSTLQIVATGPTPKLSAVMDWATARIDRLESRWSRFLPDSEVSRINRSGGSPVAVSEETIHLVDRALEARALSAGRFDPLMLGALTASGYDITFSSLLRRDRRPEATEVIDVGEVVVDEIASTVRITGSLRIDPGGIGKGLAADLVTAGMIERGARGALVNLGGDLRCRGEAPGGDGWVIEIGDDVAGVPPRVLALAAGGVASSTCRRRRWVCDTAEGPAACHHLLDPITRRASPHAAALVTVVAGSAADAEWIATSVAAAGELPSDRSILGEAALLVTAADGRTSRHGPVDRYLR